MSSKIELYIIERKLIGVAIIWSCFLINLKLLPIIYSYFRKSLCTNIVLDLIVLNWKSIKLIWRVHHKRKMNLNLIISMAGREYWSPLVVSFNTNRMRGRPRIPLFLIDFVTDMNNSGQTSGAKILQRCWYPVQRNRKWRMCYYVLLVSHFRSVLLRHSDK